MINHTNTNANIRSLENSIQVYSEYRTKIPTSHLTDELKQIKLDELDLQIKECKEAIQELRHCLLYTSPSPRDRTRSRMPSSA